MRDEKNPPERAPGEGRWVLFFEAVLQRDTAVKDQVVCGAVAVIHAEIAGAHKLEGRGVGAGAVFPLVKFGSHGSHPLFHLASGEDGEGVGVQTVQEILVRPVGLGVGEEVVIEPHLGIHGSFPRQPSGASRP